LTFFKQDATIIGQENPKLDNHHYARDFLFKKIIYMKQMKLLREEIIPLSSKQSLLLYIIIACIFQFVLFFAPTLANQAVAQNNDLPENEVVITDSLINNEVLTKSETMDESIKRAFLPAHTDKEVEVLRTGFYTMTAYNSDPRQTDDTPCITANGFNVCEHGIEDTIAANFLRFGTKVRIPELFGDRVFVVRDRMNQRYTDRVDIWMLDYQDAKKFGVKIAKIEIIE
jgi:3D (Asp-Asp-Asp) domain-containing protein